MALRAPAPPHIRRFTRAATMALGVAIVFAVLLGPWFPLAIRESVTGVGLLVAGLAATVSGAIRYWAERHRPEGRPWLLLTLGGVVLLAGNAWAAAEGADPLTSPSLFSDTTIAIALVLSLLALMVFPNTHRRGYDLMVMLLDGAVAGGAFLLIASVLVYSKLLNPQAGGTTSNDVFAMLFPALDVLLATFAVLLVVRASRTDRLMLVLVGAAFLMYAASDLAFAVRTAEGTFHFGTLLDLGWIAGYLAAAAAAWAPIGPGHLDDEATAGPADALGTTLVFGVLIAATVVQVLLGDDTTLQGARSALWVVIVMAAGARQVLLTVDNVALRRGLERRVHEQTAGLRRLARQNEVLISSVGEGIYGVDQQGVVRFVNPSGAELLGYTRERLVGRNAHDTFHAPGVNGTMRPWTDCYIAEVSNQGALTRAEEDDYVRADGSTFPVEITASPLTDESEFRGAVVVFRDVTQRREVERMKNEFLSVVSHELRTPLTSIQGSLGLLAGGRLGELSERAAPLVAVALKSSERLTRLINDLLDIERLESGVNTLELSAHDALHLLESAAAQIEGMSTSMGVTVEVVSAEGRVLADDDQILQTLLNLLGNAVKFSDPGSVVRLRARARVSDVIFDVTDQGRGIPEDKLEAIFERFEQVDSSDTRQRGGTGLGLTISRGIVTRHGGQIWAESELGIGTTVHFTLPMAPFQRVVRTVGGDAIPKGAQVVLVCDDEIAIVDQFCTLLRTHGYHPVGVTSGAEAIEVARAKQPHAVVLDLMMPGTTGAEVVAELRATPSTSHIPLVVISGLSPESDVDIAVSAQDWLIKPVSERRLLQAVLMAVSGGRATGGSVLLVEDDQPLGQVLSTMLAGEGLQVTHASTASEALILGTELRPDVMVLDLALPDGRGDDVIAEFSRRWTLANTAVVVYSAADVAPSLRKDLQLGRTVFLTKSRNSPEELRDQVMDLIRAVTSPQDRSQQDGAVDGTRADRTVASRQG